MRSTFGHRGLPIYSAAFSPDGSLIVLAHGPILTLWNAASNALLRVLDATDLGVAGATRVSFVGSGGQSLAVAGPATGLAVWDLLACDVAWSLPSQSVTQLIPLASGEFQIAVVDYKSTQLLTFSPASAHVVSRALVPDVKLSKLVEGLACERMATNAHGRPYRIASKLSADAALVSNVTNAPTDRNVRQQAAKSSVWEEMFGKDVFQNLPQSSDAVADEAVATARPKDSRSRYLSTYDGPAHTLPPARLLFESFVDDFMVLSTRERPAHVEDNAQDEPRHVYEEATATVGDVQVELVAQAAQTPLSTKVDVAKWTEWFKANVDISKRPTAATRPATPAKAVPQHKAVKQVAANGTPASAAGSAKKSKKQANGTVVTPNGSQADASPQQVGRKRKTAA